jgi:hypothetical protein
MAKKVNLTIDGLGKREANAIIKAVDQLVKLGQLPQPNWWVIDEEGMELDSQMMREQSSINKSRL